MLYRIEKIVKGKSNLFNLREARTNEIVYSTDRRIDVLNKKKALEGWKEKQKRKWNGQVDYGDISRGYA